MVARFVAATENKERGAAATRRADRIQIEAFSGTRTVVAASKLREWWHAQTGLDDSPFDAGASAWLVSLAIHLSALIALAAATLLIPTPRREMVLAARNVEAEAEPILDAFHFAQERTEEVGALSYGGTGDAVPQSLVEAPDAELAYQVDAITPVGDVQVLQINQTMLAGRNATENLLITGAGSTGAVGAAGAVDRITHEILLSLDERPTLVVWLFDQSGSLKAQRESIAKRFDRVYDELGVIEAVRQPCLPTTRRQAAAHRRRLVRRDGRTAHAEADRRRRGNQGGPCDPSTTIRPAARTYFSPSIFWPTNFATTACSRRAAT